MQQDHPEEGDVYVLACWHAPWHHVQLFFLLDRDGKPALGWQPVSDGHAAYKWNSYHAARKFQREHESELEGYFVCNLSDLYRQWRKRVERKPTA